MRRNIESCTKLLTGYLAFATLLISKMIFNKKGRVEMPDWKTQQRELLKRAVVLFPRTGYLDSTAVRAARRGWVRAVTHMRARPQSLWVLDNKVGRAVQ